MALAGNSTALESMVDKQQNKIIELVLMMHNQTDFINKLEEKSQRLEEQNRQLHEVLVNQSNMMSELVKGMKYMKEEQEKLKSTVTQPLPLTTNYSPIKEEVSADTKPPHVRDERNHEHDQNEGNNVLKDNEVPRKNDALFEGKLNIIQAPETNSEHTDNSEETASKYISLEKEPQKEVSETRSENVKNIETVSKLISLEKEPEKEVPRKKPSSAHKQEIVIPETPKYFGTKPSGPTGENKFRVFNSSVNGSTSTRSKLLTCLRIALVIKIALAKFCQSHRSIHITLFTVNIDFIMTVACSSSRSIHCQIPGGV